MRKFTHKAKRIHIGDLVEELRKTIEERDDIHYRVVMGRLTRLAERLDRSTDAHNVY